jgi:CheY-like chemotaxis protein
MSLRVKILVVEDDMIICEDLRMSLKKIGYELIDMVASGEDALDKAEEHKPDLILMDIVLKGRLNGIETADMVRSRFDIPVVFLTAYADKITLERAKSTKPYGYIFKPFDDNELAAVIEKALKKHKKKKNKAKK